MATPPPIRKKRRYLLCFSPKDAQGKEELAAHLAAGGEVLCIDGATPGESVRAAFQEAAASADAALLLLSADFFAELEKPPPGEPAEHSLAWQVEELRRQHKERKIRLVPIVWRACDWRACDWLAKLRPLPVDGSAIASMDRAQRDQRWGDVAQHLAGRGKVGGRGFLGSLRSEVQVIMPDRAALIAKSRNLLDISEADFENVVDLELSIKQVPQFVNAQHAPHVGARNPSEARPLDERLLDYVLRLERLLLVGPPGAGKTQTLRTLCRELLVMAQDDPSLPVPFLINLSTYSQYRGSLRSWLAEGLKESAAIPMAIGKVLLEQGQMFLLLDGLDELAPACRSEALAELNALMSTADPALAHCVVCSRTLEYVEAGTSLMLPGALEIQPLTLAQVREAIAQAGLQSAPWAVSLMCNDKLTVPIDTPLLLTTAVRVLSSTPDFASTSQNSYGLLHVLYDSYVLQLLQRNGTQAKYRGATMLRWLHWLAKSLHQEHSSLCLVEKMQPTMLKALWKYKTVVVLFATTAYSIFGIITSTQIVKFINVLSYELNCRLNNEKILFIRFGLPVVLCYSLLGGFHGALTVKKNSPMNKMHWSWAKLRPKELAYGLCIWLFFGLWFGLIGRPIRGIGFGLATGLAIGLPDFLNSGWVCGISIGDYGKFFLEQGERFSAYNRIRDGLVNGLICGSISGLICGSVSGMIGFLCIGTAGGLCIGLLGGLMGWLRYIECDWASDGGLWYGLKYYVTRLFLWSEGSLPLRLVPWLESCRARLLLRRQGGAYLFWHKTLQDYFAELDDVRLAELAKRIEAKPVYEQSY